MANLVNNGQTWIIEQNQSNMEATYTFSTKRTYLDKDIQFKVNIDFPYAEDDIFGSDFILPVKGDIITMNIDGTDKEYLVLKTSGTVAEVLARDFIDESVMFNTNNSNTYSGGTLDTYLNITYYNILSADAKSAIVDKNIIQYEYNDVNFVYSSDTHASYADYSTKHQKAIVGDRHIYAIGIEDIEEYFNNVFSYTDLQEMFNIDYFVEWLSSAYDSDSISAWFFYGGEGEIAHEYARNHYAARPAFQIDLSKISWS